VKVTHLQVAIVVDGRPWAAMGGMAIRHRALARAMQEFAAVHRITVNIGKTCRCRADANPRQAQFAGAHERFIALCEHVVQDFRGRIHQVRPDVIVFSGLSVTRYLFEVQDRTRHKMIYDAHNAETHRYSSFALSATRLSAQVPPRFLASYTTTRTTLVQQLELAVCHTVDQIWAVSDIDASILRRSVAGGATASVCTIPTTVDPTDYIWDPGARRQTAFFLGRLDYLPNIDAAFKFVDIARRAGVNDQRGQYLIAGANPPEELVYIAASTGVRLLANLRDLTPLLTKGILLAPISLGGGSRTKILECFASGTPMVLTPKAVEGIDAEPDVHYLTAHDGSEFAEGYARLRASANLRRGLADNARELLHRNYTVHQMGSAISSSRLSVRR
jgi:glycosyltransferase involved in cell wall biosynthesis